MARVSSSLPWLFPVQESLYPDEVIRTNVEKATLGQNEVCLCVSGWVGECVGK